MRKGLGMRKSGTVLWIAPKDEIDERTKKDYEAALAIQKTGTAAHAGISTELCKKQPIWLLS